jgi:hypothetical protein
MLNRRGGELIDTSRPPPAPITLPPINLPDLDSKAIEWEFIALPGSTPTHPPGTMGYEYHGRAVEIYEALARAGPLW